MGYCEVGELITLGLINPSAIQGVDPLTQQTAIDVAADEINGYFAGRYPLPLITWDRKIRQVNAWLAVYAIMSGRGFDPSRPGDDGIQLRYDAAIKWCVGVQERTIHPTVTFSDPGPPAYQTPQVSSMPQRNFYPLSRSFPRGPQRI